MNIKSGARHYHSGALKRLGITLIPALLLVGCARTHDIKSGYDSYTGTTLKHDVELFDCIKESIYDGEELFVIKTNEKSMLFVGAPDPIEASGLVELSSHQGNRSYSVYQRHAWSDRGRLINAAVQCAKT